MAWEAVHGLGKTDRDRGDRRAGGGRHRIRRAVIPGRQKGGGGQSPGAAKGPGYGGPDTPESLPKLQVRIGPAARLRDIAPGRRTTGQTAPRLHRCARPAPTGPLRGPGQNRFERLRRQKTFHPLGHRSFRRQPAPGQPLLGGIQGGQSARRRF